MLEVVTFKWRNPGYRSQFTATQVNVLYRMIARHYRGEFRLSCVTDDANGLDPAIRAVPLWDDHASVPSPHGRAFPSCYRRLKLFSAEAEDLFGPVILAIDLDVVITRDVTETWNDQRDFVICRGQSNPQVQPYNGSMFLLRAGSRTKVWDEFDPARSPREAWAAGRRGSDQGWIAHILGPGEATWGPEDGVYSYRNNMRAKNPAALPANARVVNFHGKLDPWTPMARKTAPWIAEHYR